MTDEEKEVYLTLMGWECLENTFWCPSNQTRRRPEFMLVLRTVRPGRPMPTYYTLHEAYEIQSMLNDR